MRSTTPEHQDMVRRILVSLDKYLQEQKFGNVYADIEFILGENTRLHPDLAVILGNNWRRTVNKFRYPGHRRLQLEVISPGGRTTYSPNKVRIYLGQVKEVWQVPAGRSRDLHLHILCSPCHFGRTPAAALAPPSRLELSCTASL